MTDADVKLMIARELKTLSDETLRHANSAIVEELKRRNRAKCAAAANEFRGSDKVQFTDRRTGRVLRGTVLSVGPKNVKVLVAGHAPGAGSVWTVTATLLSRDES